MLLLFAVSTCKVSLPWLNFLHGVKVKFSKKSKIVFVFLVVLSLRSWWFPLLADGSAYPTFGRGKQRIELKASSFFLAVATACVDSSLDLEMELRAGSGSYPLWCSS